MADSVMYEPRVIQSVVCEQFYNRVTEDGVTAIEAYNEGGEMGYVPWFKVWRGTELHRRINGHYVVHVDYVSDQKLDDETPF